MMLTDENKKYLLTGNEACAEAAIQAGCRFYYGYPITPQNEILTHMALRMPQVGGTCIQVESELAAINMVHGSAAAGARAMTSSSSLVSVSNKKVFLIWPEANFPVLS